MLPSPPACARFHFMRSFCKCGTSSKMWIGMPELCRPNPNRMPRRRCGALEVKPGPVRKLSRSGNLFQFVPSFCRTFRRIRQRELFPSVRRVFRRYRSKRPCVSPVAAAAVTGERNALSARQRVTARVGVMSLAATAASPRQGRPGWKISCCGAVGILNLMPLSDLMELPPFQPGGGWSHSHISAN